MYIFRLMNSPRFVRLRGMALAAEGSCSESRSFTEWSNCAADEMVDLLDRYGEVWKRKMNQS